MIADQPKFTEAKSIVLKTIFVITESYINEMAFNPSFLPDLLFTMVTGADHKNKNLY